MISGVSNRKGDIMFEKVSIEEIKNIRGRLETELEDKNLPFHRREEVESLVNYINTWVCWKEYQDRERYREQLQSES
ncbi:hypothetical protein ES703_10942 [subsurface metagenome]